MPTKNDVRRLDFKIEILNQNPKTGYFEFRLIPDPERYEIREHKGKKYYYDKFDDFYITLETITKAMKNVRLPIYYLPPKNENIDSLLLSRTDEIKSFLNGNEQRYRPHDKSERFLSSLKKRSIKHVILSIDLKGSTRMSQALNEQDYAKILTLFSKEMTIIVNNFNGFVLKTLGDGLVCYFPEPNFIGMNDNAVNCAFIMKKFIVCCLNPILKDYKFPELKFRMGLDSGEAIKVIMGAENVKEHLDLVGETINIATKIQSLAGENDIFLGESTVLNVHTYWRKKIKKVEMPSKWEYVDKKTNKPYQVYRLMD